MEIIDRSVPIVPSSPETPDLLRAEIELSDHAAAAKSIIGMFAVGPELLRDGEGWAVETFTRLGTTTPPMSMLPTATTPRFRVSLHRTLMS